MKKQVTFWVKSKLVFLILKGMIELNFECEKANQFLSKKQTTFYKYISTYITQKWFAFWFSNVSNHVNYFKWKVVCFLLKNWFAFWPSKFTSIITCKIKKLVCFLPKKWLAFHFHDLRPLTIKVESCLLLTQKVTCFSFLWPLTFYKKNWKILKKIENGKFDLLLTQKLACLSFPGNVFEIGLLLFTWFSKNCLLLTWKVTCFLFLLMTFDL